MTRAEKEPAELQMDSTWGRICVEATGGRVIACRLPALHSEPEHLFGWKRVKLSGGTAADRAALVRARRYVKALFRGSAGKPPPLQEPEAAPFTRRV